MTRIARSSTSIARISRFSPIASVLALTTLASPVAAQVPITGGDGGGSFCYAPPTPDLPNVEVPEVCTASCEGTPPVEPVINVTDATLFTRFFYVFRCNGARATEARCGDEAYLNSTCGALAMRLGQCNRFAPALRASFADRLDEVNVAEGMVGHEAASVHTSGGEVDPFAGRDLAWQGFDPRRYGEAMEGYDTSSFRSLMERLHADARAGGSGAGLLGFLMNLNGTAASSCFEYTFERYYDQTIFEMASMPLTSSRAVFDLAFGPASADTSIGTRNVCARRPLHSRDGSFSFEPLMQGSVISNAFKVPHINPEYVFGGAGSTRLPEALLTLWQSLPGTAEVDVTWEWNAAMSRTMRTMERFRPAQIAPSCDHPCGATRVDGYTDEELNYLYALQKRYTALLSQLKAVQPDIRVVDNNPVSGWVNDLINPPILAPALDLQNEIRQSRLGFSVIGDIEISRELYVNPRVLASMQSREGSLGYELLVLMYEARAWGCLEEGPTPCDWSPDLFAELVANRYKADQEAAFDQCESYVESASDFRAARPLSFMPGDTTWSSRSPANARWLVNLDIECVAEPPEGFPNPSACSPSTGPGPAHVPWSRNDIYYGGDMRGATATLFDEEELDRGLNATQRLNSFDTFFGRSRVFDKIAGDGLQVQATARIVSTAPELFHDNGMHLPHYTKSGGESLGNDMFHVAYDWSADTQVSGLRSTAVGASLCRAGAVGANGIRLDSHIEANVTLGVLGANLELFHGDANGTVRGDSTKTISASTRILGRNLFTRAASPPLNVIAGGASQDHEEKGFDAWFTILVIPVHVTAGFSATAGIEAELYPTVDGCSADGLDPNIGLDAIITPSISAGGFATAAVDVGIARAGVKGNLTLISLALPIGAHMSVADGRLSINTAADLELATLSGRLAAFVEVGVSPFSTSAERTLVSWSGPSFGEQLYSRAYTLELDDMRKVDWN